MGIFRRGMNIAAFGNGLKCPVCDSSSIKFIENIGPFRLRYRCKKCNTPFQYETGRDNLHPYSPFNKPLFNKIVEQQVNKGTHPEGKILIP
jgi:transposase-like protein